MPELVMVYVHRGRDEARWRWECSELCRRMHWDVAAITQDPDTARRAAASGEVDRVVVARPAHERILRIPVTVASDPPRRSRRRPRRLTPREEDG